MSAEVSAGDADAPDTTRTPSVSSEVSLPPPEDDADSVCSDELLGSQSARWWTDIRDGGLPPESADVNRVGRDGLFVDHHFPLGELEMQVGVTWKRPKVKRKKSRRNPTSNTSSSVVVQNKQLSSIGQYLNVKNHT